MVQFGFLSAYDLLDLYLYFKKVMQSGHHKVESVNKQFNWRQLLFWIRFQSSSTLVCPSLGDVEKLQKILQLKNLDTEAAEIMKSFWFGTNLGELT